MAGAALRRWAGWAQRLVLAETGQPVELIHIEEFMGHRRLFVQLPSGVHTHVPEAALTTRAARMTEGTMVLAGVAVAGMLLGWSLAAPPAQDETAVDGSGAYLVQATPG